jgi:hypothetical protein
MSNNDTIEFRYNVWAHTEQINDAAASGAMEATEGPD